MNPNSHSGNRKTRNYITGIGSALTTNSEEMIQHNVILPRGSILYNEDTMQLSIADGKTPSQSLPDHVHRNYSPVWHSHITSANEVWRISEPRLWYTDDLHNHPELLALDGSEIPEDKAVHLSKVYPGTTLLTTPCERMDQDGFQNNTITLSVDEFQSEFVGGRLTGEAIDTENMLIYTDQWLTNTTNVNKAQSIVIKFKNDYTYIPNEYWIIPAAGVSSAPLKDRPTPRNWTFEGSNDGEHWDVLDERTDVLETEWHPLTINLFKLSVIPDAYSYLKLNITKWNTNTGDPLETGLRRFWVFGNKVGVFTLPNLESPDDSFSWVVPYKDLDVGLRHEAIGDVGMTSASPENLPRYRLPADGKSYYRESYPELFNYTGFSQDNECTITTMIASGGSVLKDNKWEIAITDKHQAAYIEIYPNWDSDDAMGGYYIGQSNTNVPLAWIVEGTVDGSEYDTLQLIQNTTSEDMAAQNYKFLLDKTITDKHYTRIRITFTEWATANSRATIQFKLFAHKLNHFYVPNITIEGSGECYPYVVCNNTAEDVSSEVIANLQNNVAKLTKMVADLQNTVNEQNKRLNIVYPQTTKTNVLSD